MLAETKKFYFVPPGSREVEVNHRDPEELMVEYQQIVHQLEAAQAALKVELVACLRGKA